MILKLSRTGICLPLLIQTEIQSQRTTPLGRRRYAGVTHRAHQVQVVWVVAGNDEGAGYGAWMVIGHKDDEEPGANAAGAIMQGQYRVRRSSSKCMADILGRSIPPASYSTMMHQVLILRDRCRRKYMGSISYSTLQYMHACISLLLCLTMNRMSVISISVSEPYIFH